MEVERVTRIPGSMAKSFGRTTSGVPPFQRFRFARSFERLTLNLFDRLENTQSFFTIRLDPPRQVFKGSRIKFQAWHGRPRMEYLPDGSWPL